MSVVLRIAGEPIPFEEIWTFIVGNPEFLQEFAYARLFKQKMKTFVRADLPPALQAALSAPQPGSLLGPPLLIGEWWYLIYVHKFILASDDDLDQNLQEQISEALFEQQLAAKVNEQSIEIMEVTWSQLR